MAEAEDSVAETNDAMVAMVSEAAATTEAANEREVHVRLWEDRNFRSF